MLKKCMFNNPRSGSQKKTFGSTALLEYSLPSQAQKSHPLQLEDTQYESMIVL